MIYYILGELISKTEEEVIIEANGIGYQIFVPETLISQLPEVGTQTKVFTYHHVREDAQVLYGFVNQEDRKLFILLTSVSGVGPKVGLKILSALNVQQFVEAVIKEDIAVLSSVSGVGKKMAERLVVELKDKLPKLYVTTNIPGDNITSTSSIKPDDDLIQALKTLGYSNDEIKKAYQRSVSLISKDQPLEQSIKILLKNL